MPRAEPTEIPNYSLTDTATKIHASLQALTADSIQQQLQAISEISENYEKESELIDTCIRDLTQRILNKKPGFFDSKDSKDEYAYATKLELHLNKLKSRAGNKKNFYELSLHFKSLFSYYRNQNCYKIATLMGTYQQQSETKFNVDLTLISSVLTNAKIFHAQAQQLAQRQQEIADEISVRVSEQKQIEVDQKRKRSTSST